MNIIFKKVGDPTFHVEHNLTFVPRIREKVFMKTMQVVVDVVHFVEFGSIAVYIQPEDG